MRSLRRFGSGLVKGISSAARRGTQLGRDVWGKHGGLISSAIGEVVKGYSSTNPIAGAIASGVHTIAKNKGWDNIAKMTGVHDDDHPKTKTKTKKKQQVNSDWVNTLRDAYRNTSG